ncbi:hypothetical protein [Maricaulis sp.]|uniref:hypothetical protein n=1 Tax=Maricaulis sp. TaxID=1486257 RepID=UPI0025C1A610|nr:hypothetical protein [Maricaulis sp.]
MTTNLAGAYITGLFGKSDLLAPTQSELLASRMNDYIFWSVHVNPDGNLHYNDVPLVTNGVLDPTTGAGIGGIISAARKAGLAQNVWFSVGSGGVSDFQNIQSILNRGGANEANLFANFQVLMDLGADGFDLDYEEYLTEPAGLISRFTIELNQRMGAKLTYCPYYGVSMWIDCLKANMTELGSQPVVGFNLQCYAGGASNDPRIWVQEIHRAGSSIGVSNAQAFVRPGMAVAGSPSAPALTPSQMTAQLNTWQSPGGWIWNTANVLNSQSKTGYSITDYASAMLAAAPVVEKA